MEVRSPQSAIVRVTPGTLVGGEPIDTPTLKAYLRITGSAEDAFISTLCSVARGIAERLTGRCIPKQTLTGWLDFIPYRDREWWDGVREGAINFTRSSYIEMPRPPLISVQAVTAWQNDDTSVVMDASQYFVDTSTDYLPGRVVLRLGAFWPVGIRPRNAYSVAYTAGYEDAAVPADLKHAILLMASWLYKNRGDSPDDGVGIASGAMNFLNNYLVRRAS